jgi:hypothetical protein
VQETLIQQQLVVTNKEHGFYSYSIKLVLEKNVVLEKNSCLFWKRTLSCMQSTIACGKSLSKLSTATGSMYATICCIIKVITTVIMIAH